MTIFQSGTQRKLTMIFSSKVFKEEDFLHPIDGVVIQEFF